MSIQSKRNIFCSNVMIQWIHIIHNELFHAIPFLHPLSKSWTTATLNNGPIQFKRHWLFLILLYIPLMVAQQDSKCTCLWFLCINQAHGICCCCSSILKWCINLQIACCMFTTVASAMKHSCSISKHVIMCAVILSSRSRTVAYFTKVFVALFTEYWSLVIWTLYNGRSRVVEGLSYLLITAFDTEQGMKRRRCHLEFHIREERQGNRKG